MAMVLPGLGKEAPCSEYAMPFTKLFAVALAAVWLAACAHASVVSRRSEVTAPAQRPSLEPYPHAALGTDNRTHLVSLGLASFYTEGTLIASGEIFNAHEFTAAHRTLPFGTRLRVTNVANRPSVLVRVNDRRPFVPGRVVDVSYSAAETLGMVGGGIVKVKLDVLR
jgi:rare lipoprotein A